jgi:mono/diheme cytochrome c family protein
VTRRLRMTVNYATISMTAVILSITPNAFAQNFRNAPASAAELKNPYSGDASAAAGGKKVFSQNCAQCHGNDLQGIGPAPALTTTKVKSAAPGELFWFITNGDLNKGMPGWVQIPKPQRWQVVTFLELKNGAK